MNQSHNHTSSIQSFLMLKNIIIININFKKAYLYKIKLIVHDVLDFRDHVLEIISFLCRLAESIHCSAKQALHFPKY